MDIKSYAPHLRQVMWPPGFKLSASIDNYTGSKDPETWLMNYEIAVRAAGGDESEMANYFPAALDQATSQWL